MLNRTLFKCCLCAWAPNLLGMNLLAPIVWLDDWLCNRCSIRIVPVYALKFGLNDTFKQLFAKPGQDIAKTGLETWQLIAAGATAGIVQGSLTFPLDLVKTRWAANRSPRSPFLPTRTPSARACALDSCQSCCAAARTAYSQPQNHQFFVATLESRRPFRAA